MAPGVLLCLFVCLHLSILAEAETRGSSVYQVSGEAAVDEEGEVSVALYTADTVANLSQWVRLNPLLTYLLTFCPRARL